MTTYKADFPEEPPVGTVVLDKDGTVWQRSGMPRDYPTWVAARIDPTFERNNLKFWPMLLMEFGPLTELYRPEETTDEA